ncbi:Lrp/AsnC family transcriptional regulator [Natronobacterium texcoconense]|uniref:DNA-binding transcriptional regulator, Lrp family n=1 Tax=Natronobacterium texcoconense TaxID=1095778 RepID=A0A1H1CD58_NATTX|nr:Lrp/AsnC family transcriptional regulator [Natronobacterium texcoconense]SDQ62113.1 DNA-binding transcriptional regulator, Lrp family [Natronobacterium texcoconense]
MVDETTALDEVERSILYHLQEDARNVTNAEISEAVGVSATTVGQRIADLEERGIVDTYHTMVDYERSGFPHRILLFCSVHPDDRHDAADDVIDVHGVISVRELITGNRNLHVEIVGRTREEIVDTISAIEHNGIAVEDSELIKNESRRPFDDFDPDCEE